MIRVLIMRQVAAGYEDDFRRTVQRLRGEAIRAPGFISAETFRDVCASTNYFILSMWDSREAWDAWADSPTRRRILDEITPLLDEPERVTILEPAWRAGTSASPDIDRWAG
jgi:heme-degrading monooxygenase HmoA